jgi:hypothetical protein
MFSRSDADEGAQHDAGEGGIEGHAESEPERNGQHPLPPRRMSFIARAGIDKLAPFQRLLDFLISVNIATGVVLLLVAIYVSDALKIATFPTLLLTTLFRLALEVSATRLILLRAEAGEVIRAFGNFVVAGNLVVGAVVFLILTRRSRFCFSPA